MFVCTESCIQVHATKEIQGNIVSVLIFLRHVIFSAEMLEKQRYVMQIIVC